MTETKKLTPTEALGALQAQGRALDLADETAKKTPEQRAKDLAARGIDPKRERARFDEIRAKLRAELDPPKPKRQARAAAGWLSAGLALGGAAGYALATRTAAPQEPSTPATAGAPADARALRDEAFRACARGDGARCLRLFDEAKALDPSGEDDDVRAARARAR